MSSDMVDRYMPTIVGANSLDGVCNKAFREDKRRIESYEWQTAATPLLNITYVQSLTLAPPYVLSI